MNKNIYPQVMYETLGQVKPQEARYNNDDRKRTEPLENMVSALVLTQHQHLISHILADEKLSNQTFTEILEAYFETGKLQNFLKTLKQYPKQDHNFNLEEYIKKLIQKSSEQEIYNFAECVTSLDDRVYYILKLLENLWQEKQFDFAQKIVEKYLSSEEQKALIIVHNLYQKNFPNSDEVITAVEEVSNIEAEDGERSWSHQQKLDKILSFLLQELDQNDVDIAILKSAIVAHEQAKKEKKVGYMSGRDELDRKVRNHLYENGKFEEAEEFIKLLGDRKYHQNELLRAKLNYAIQKKDKTMHKEALDTYVLSRDSEIKELFAPSGKKVGEDNGDGSSFTWRKRNELCGAQAMKNCELAIFELLHGDDQKAQEYIQLMIQYTESITQDIPEDCSTRDKGHLKGRVKIPFKKGLKERFLQLRLFRYLPADIGWNHPIKDPEQRASESSNRRKKRISERKKREKEYEEEQTKQEAEKTELIQIFLEENRIDDVITFIEQELEWIVSRADWERGMLILEYSPESFHRLFQILGKDYFSRDSHRSDHFDYEAMAQFFVRGSQLGVVQKTDWEQLVNRMNEYSFTRDGRRQIPHTAVVSLVKYSIASGNIWQAWEFFESIRKGDSRYRGEAVSNSTVSACLSHFIRGTTNQESRNGIHLAFNDIDLENENISLVEQIKYWNTKSNIACAFNDDKKYQFSIEALQKTLESSENQHQVIRTWCRDLVEHCLRDHHQIKNEMEVLLNSDFGKTEKIRRRIIYTLIELGVPGMEAYTDIKKKNAPERAQHFFLQKLVEKGYLSQKIERFLGKDWREHVPYLRRLLAQHQNEFNTVIRTLSEINEIRGWGKSEEELKEAREKMFQPSQWENVFETISLLQDLYKKLHDDSDKESKSEEEGKNFFNKNFTFIFNLKRSEYFSSEEKTNNFTNLLQYVNIYFLNTLSKGSRFSDTFVNDWDGSIEGFLSTFITLEYLNDNVFDNRIAVLKNFKTNEELQTFFRNFVLQKAIDDEEYDLIAQSLVNLEKVPKEERQKNIENINHQQSQFLEEKNNEDDYSWNKVNLEKFDKKKRTLVLYCRHYQISPVDFTVLAKTAQRYIQGGYSKVFNDIQIVSRESGEYYKEFVSGIDYQDIAGRDFQETCSIFANTIHFTHGQPDENKFGSTPILSASVRGDNEKMGAVNKSIPLHLKLDPRDHIQTPKNEELFDGDMQKMSQEIIRAIIELENQMLSGTQEHK